MVLKKNNRTKKYLLIDTEGSQQNGLPIAYDIGLLVVDRYGNHYEEISYLITDIFFDNKELMEKAYYAKKIPHYYDLMRKKEIKAVKFTTARRNILKLIEKYKINTLLAYNARYDIRALDKTLDYLTKGKQDRFFPDNFKYGCIWAMAKDTICREKGYLNFTEENQFVTKKGNPRTTAEVVMRYILGNPNWEEEHTGLEDAKIEKAIFRWSMAKKQKMSHHFKPMYEEE